MRRWLVWTLVAVLGCGGDDAAAPTVAGSSGAVDPDSTSGMQTTGSGAAGSDVSGEPSTSTAADVTSGVTQGSDSSGGDASTTGAPDLLLPPPGVLLDYQLGGAYEPPAGVQVVSRDRTATPAPGLYNICYVNGYQTQPNEEQWWLDEHPELLLRDEDGSPFIDPDWNEILLDITTPRNRAALADIVGDWMDGCGDAGFDAIEIDNLDTYARSDGLISQDSAVAFMALLSARAHAAGLAIAQKNSTEIADRQPEMGTDFAVAEECNRWSECQDYKDVYGELVYVIEYRAQDFEAGCSAFPELSTVLRDLNLVTPGDGAYVYETCS